jgi:hypothetical protein
MNVLFGMLGGAAYEVSSMREYYYRKKAEKAQEERREETRRFKASLDNGEGFKANFEPVNDYNWGMFKNED